MDTDQKWINKKGTILQNKVPNQSVVNKNLFSQFNILRQKKIFDSKNNLKNQKSTAQWIIVCQSCTLVKCVTNLHICKYNRLFEKWPELAIGQFIFFGISEFVLIRHEQCTKNGHYFKSCHYHKTKKVLKSIFWPIDIFSKTSKYQLFFNTNTFIAIDFYANQLLSVKNEWFQTQMSIIQFLRFDFSYPLFTEFAHSAM